MSPQILAADVRSATRRRSQPAPPPNHHESRDLGGKSLNWYPNLDSCLLKYSIQGYFAPCYFRSFSLANGFAPPLIHQEKVLNKER